MRLTDDELRDVLARAEEIQRHTLQPESDLDALLGAAEEAGFARPAIELALRERFNFLTAAPEPGSLVFARSADGKFYVAEVLSSSAEAVRVRFLRGSEHVATLDQLQPCSFNPGQRVTCEWPHWGAYTCSVVRYDASQQTVTLSDGWSSPKTFPIAEVWLEPPRRRDPARAGRKAIYAALGAGASVGAVIGSLITALVLR
jgi:hypothetical protein